MKVALTLVLVLFGQKPATINLPMPDIRTCLAEADRFLNLEQSQDKPRVVFRAAGCMVGDPSTSKPGEDASQ